MMADPESSMQSVISNNDLLAEILIRLPVLSLVLFKSVSKHWLSLIKGANVTFRQNLDPISGLFLNKISYKDHSRSLSYDFVPLDVRIPICRSSLVATKFTFGPKVHGDDEILDWDVEILDSCNCLLLCRTHIGELYVYNPSITNMFKLLPDIVTRSHGVCTFKLAFDPTKSPHYKVVFGEPFEEEWLRIHTYSSETGNWSLCAQFPIERFFSFRDGVYWNDAILWLNGGDEFFKLDIMNEHPVLTALQTPLTLDTKECMLFESRGCLLFVDEGDADSRHFTIYEKGNVYSEWSVKYIVNLNDTIKRFPKRRSIDKNIFCIVLGEREEDSFLVMEIDRKVVQLKIVSKTLNTISDLGPNEDLLECFQFIPSFATV